MTKQVSWFVFYLLFSTCLIAQNQTITLEDIFSKGTFTPKGIERFQWADDGKSYTKFVEDEINQTYSIQTINIETGKSVGTITSSDFCIIKGDTQAVVIQEYEFCKGNSRLLIKTNTQSIYRRSYTASYYVLDLATKKFTSISNGEAIAYATFSPDGTKIAYCKGNNLYYYDLLKDTYTQITTDGKKNEIINGSADWVYEEEFEITKAFVWSPDSKSIGYMRFDERQVKEYNMQVWDGLYPKDNRFKYPKAGEKNTDIQLYIYSVLDGKTTQIFDGTGKDLYVPRIHWGNDPNTFRYVSLNRAQDTAVVYAYSLLSTKTSKDYILTDKAYVEVSDATIDLLLANIKLEEDDELIKINTKSKLVYFTSRRDSPLEKQLYVASLDGKSRKRLTTFEGTNTIDMNDACTYFICTNTTPNSIKYSLHRAKDGKLLRVLEDNSAFENKLKQYRLSKMKFDTFSINKEIALNYWMMYPTDFDSTKKYPVLLFCYGGPGSQQVTKDWKGRNYLWYQYLTAQGFIIACTDNRGTGGRGRDFKKCTTRQLGKLESEDQIAFAQFLGQKKFVEKSKIGIWGWSFGGYLSTLSLLLGNEVFKLAIAVAPVTSWRFYDTIYTERFLKNPSDNAKGYDDYSPLTHANKLKGNYLLIHGTGDDNVHFQNAVEMQDALIKAGKQFDSFYYPDRNHGISGGNTRLHLYQLMTNFLEKNLK